MTRRRTLMLMAIVAVVVCLALAAWAQGGPGKGRGAGAGRMGQPCPYGNQQPGGAQGGWWTRVQPKTDQEKAFVAQVTQLHEQIRTKQLALSALQAQKAPQSQITAAQSEVNALRDQLHDVMVKNQAICTQLGVPACAANANCYGACMNCGQACMNGQACPCPLAGTAQCAWWNRVQPTTPAEKAFAADVTSLQGQITAAQTAGDQAKADALRAQLRDLMTKNQAMVQQLMKSAGGPGCGMGMGMGKGRGGGAGRGKGCGPGGCPLAN